MLYGIGLETDGGGAGGAGQGDDIYFVDYYTATFRELVIEGFGEGRDTVRSSVPYVLPENVEVRYITGTGSFAGIGNALANILTGGDGGDWLNGGLGNDQLFGGAGNDALLGGNGNDRLDGGLGVDTLTGGQNSDVFVLSKTGANGDVITDFVGNGANAGDTLLLTGWGAGTVWARTAVPGQLMITEGIDNTVALVTVNGTIHTTDVIFG